MGKSNWGEFVKKKIPTSGMKKSSHWWDIFFLKIPFSGKNQILFSGKGKKKRNSRKSVRWSAVPVAPMSVDVGV